MNVLDLFSGIGGFSLGLERAGMRTVVFCEIDPFCRAVLRKHWPKIPCFEDVRKLTAADIQEPVDVICGGFPCQPFSTASAGKRKGAEHDHYLWPEMLRIIQEFQPSWVCGENVIGIESMALEQVVSDLEACGYEVAPPFEIPACGVGHDHRRARFWFLAYANKDSKPSCAINAKAPFLPRGDCDPGRMVQAHGISEELGALRAYGNAVVPQIPEIIGRAIMKTEAA